MGSLVARVCFQIGQPCPRFGLARRLAGKLKELLGRLFDRGDRQQITAMLLGVGPALARATYLFDFLGRSFDFLILVASKVDVSAAFRH